MPVKKGATRIVITEVRKYIGSVRRVIVLEAVDVLRLTTPVATGHARNNWIPTMGRATNEVCGSRESPSSEAQDRGIREIIDEPLDSRRVASIANNVPYIRHLNEGSSTKAPQGFVEAAIAQAKVNARLLIGRLRRAK